MLLQFLGLTVLNSAISTLRSMFLARKQYTANLITTFIDALIFATIMKQISSGTGLSFAIMYALGRTFGVFLGGKIENKFALGIIQVDVYGNHLERIICIADKLRDLGYATETVKVYGYKGKPRYKITVTIDRKEKDVLYAILKKYGYDEPTIVSKDVNNVKGKITTRATTSTETIKGS